MPKHKETGFREFELYIMLTYWHALCVLAFFFKREKKRKLGKNSDREKREAEKEKKRIIVKDGREEREVVRAV